MMSARARHLVACACLLVKTACSKHPSVTKWSTGSTLGRRHSIADMPTLSSTSPHVCYGMPIRVERRAQRVIRESTRWNECVQGKSTQLLAHETRGGVAGGVQEVLRPATEHRRLYSTVQLHPVTSNPSKHATVHQHAAHTHCAHNHHRFLPTLMVSFYIQAQQNTPP